jgi:hypothetical protein
LSAPGGRRLFTHLGASFFSGARRLSLGDDELAVLSLKGCVHDLVSVIIECSEAATATNSDHDYNVTMNVTLIAPLPEINLFRCPLHSITVAEGAKTHPSPLYTLGPHVDAVGPFVR